MSEIQNIDDNPALQRIADHEHALTWTMPNGEVVIRPGLILTVFFAQGYSAEGRQKIAAVFDYFTQRYGERLTGKMLSGANDGRYSALRKGGYEALRREATQLEACYALEWGLFSEKTQEVAPEYSIETLTSQDLTEERFGKRSYLKVCLPWRELSGDEGAHAFKELVLFVCNTLAVEHGYAGLSPVLPYDFDRYMSFEYPLSQQFAGLVIDSVAYGHGKELKNHSIKGVNWLTIVGNELLNKLGGPDKVQQQLHIPGVQVHPYSSGLIVQAGDYPSLGAEDEGLPPLYVAVNRVFKPIRIADPDQLHYHMPDRESFDKEATLRWYGRFDVDEPAAKREVLRALPGDQVPRSGKWYSPAINGGTPRYFNAGEHFPQTESTSWGAVIWYWRPEDQDAVQ